MVKYKIINAATVEPVTLEEIRHHLRLTPTEDSPESHPDDDEIMYDVAQARDWCEQWTNRTIAQKTFEVALDAFPSGSTAIELPFAPVIAVESIKYIDPDDGTTVQTMSASEYVVDDYQEPCKVTPVTDTTWPTAYDTPNAVKIRYQAGYTLTGDSPDDHPLPPSIRAAVLLMAGYFYENHEPTKLENTAVESLLLPYRLRLSMR